MVSFDILVEIARRESVKSHLMNQHGCVAFDKRHRVVAHGFNRRPPNYFVQ